MRFGLDEIVTSLDWWHSTARARAHEDFQYVPRKSAAIKRLAIMVIWMRGISFLSPKIQPIKSMRLGNMFDFTQLSFGQTINH